MSNILIQHPFVPKGVNITLDIDAAGEDIFDWLEDLPRIAKALKPMSNLERSLRTIFNRPVRT